MQQIGRPPERKRIPVVQEVQSILALMAGTEALMAALLYGSGLRLSEALGLCIKDVDFDRHAIVVRSGKGDKDRVVMLPKALWRYCHRQRHFGQPYGRSSWRAVFLDGFQRVGSWSEAEHRSIL